MDKTYSDLMDIVNRTKKFDGGSRPAPARPRPRPQVVEEVEEDEYVPREYDIEENEGRGKKGSNLFGGAIGKLISEDKPKKCKINKIYNKYLLMVVIGVALTLSYIAVIWTNENEDIISVCDKLISSLNLAKKNAEEILEMLYEMKRKYSNPPL